LQICIVIHSCNNNYCRSIQIESKNYREFFHNPPCHGDYIMPTRYLLLKCHRIFQHFLFQRSNKIS
jgi:hypothetical protein